MPPRETRPLKQRQLKTLFLRVPTDSWAAVSQGRISEFRAHTGNTPHMWNLPPLPTLAVIFRKRPPDARDYRLVLLTGVRQEALGAITAEGLAAAGYTGEHARTLFRREWAASEHKRFEPLRRVYVFTVELLRSDEQMMDAGVALVNHLYGEFLESRSHDNPRSVQAS
jgi:hypothetical protein